MGWEVVSLVSPEVSNKIAVREQLILKSLYEVAVPLSFLCHPKVVPFEVASL